MKKIRKNIKMIIGIVIGVIISVTTSYVLAATLINSKDVVYQDNMSIGATNVQNAIDGTCTKIDTRLSEIEDKLYTIKEIKGNKSFSTSTTLKPTGVSITLPANSYCSITVKQSNPDSAPIGMTIGTNTTNIHDNWLDTGYDNSMPSRRIHLTLSAYFTDINNVVYIWASAEKSNLIASIYWDGFCATKVK